MSKTIFNVSWLDLISAAISGDSNVQAIATATDVQLQAVSNAIKECILLARLDELDEEVVDLLAWQYHVDFYDSNLDLSQKRKLVKTSIDAHRHKGTPYAVELVVKAILDDAVVQEWFEYGGEPYYFRVIKIGGQMIDTDTYTRLKKAIDTVKNTRSWLEGVSLYREMSGALYLAGAASVHKKIGIYPVSFKITDINSVVYMSGAVSIHKKIEVM